MVVLKKFESERSYILAELFNICLKECCFSNYLKVSWVVMYFRMFGKDVRLKTTALLVFFLHLVKSLENFVNNRLFDHQEKCALFCDFQYGFKSCRSISDLLTVASNRIASAL